MLRLLIAGFLIYLLWSFWKRMTAAARHATTLRGAHAPNPVPPDATPAEMIACARCGTFVLKAEAISRSGASYCSEACADSAT
jgi:hypothetical protein